MLNNIEHYTGFEPCKQLVFISAHAKEDGGLFKFRFLSHNNKSYSTYVRYEIDNIKYIISKLSILNDIIKKEDDSGVFTILSILSELNYLSIHELNYLIDKLVRLDDFHKFIMLKTLNEWETDFSKIDKCMNENSSDNSFKKIYEYPILFDDLLVVNNIFNEYSKYNQ